MIMAQYCPQCGFRLADTRPRGHLRRLASFYSGYRQRRITTFQSTALAPWPPPATNGSEGRYLEAERRSPYRPQNAESDFLVPLLQTLGTGVFVTIGAGWVAWLYRGFTWEMAVGCGLIAAGGFWMLTVFANRKLLWVVEKIVNSDLDDDGEVGEPQPRPAPVSLEVVHKSEDNAFLRMFRFALPDGITDTDFRDFARGVILEKRGLAESAWTGTGKLFSKPKYSELLDALDRAGIVRWRNEKSPAQGRDLTGAGRRALLAYVYGSARTHTHAPTGDSAYEFIEGVG